MVRGAAGVIVGVVGAALAGGALAGGPTTVTVTAVRTNTLYESEIGLMSGGMGNNIFAGVSGGSVRHRGLIYFDLAAAVIPVDAVVSSASLRLVCTRSSSGAQSLGVHRVQADWGAGTSDPDGVGGGGGGGVGARATNGDATWLHRFYDEEAELGDGGDVRWANPGGDFDAGALATTGVSGTGTYNWSSSALGELVQAWAAEPAANFGLLLKGPELAVGSSKRFASVHGTASQRPRLTITYTVPPPPFCAADIGVQGGTEGHDGLLDNNDFIVFFGFFFLQDPRADVGVQGGTPGTDGAWNNNDFIVFIDAFFTRAGCPE